MTTQHTRRTDAAAWGAELKQLRAAGLSGRDGLAGADGGDVHMSWWAQPHARAGGRSWGPGGIQRAQSGTVVAARCHQSSNAAAQPRRFPRRLAGREHVDELRREQAAAAPRAQTELAGPRHAATRTVLRAPAGSRGPSPSRSVPSSSQRRCTPSSSSSSSSSSSIGPRQRRRALAAKNIGRHAGQIAGRHASRKTTRLGPLGGRNSDFGPGYGAPDARMRLAEPSCAG